MLRYGWWQPVGRLPIWEGVVMSILHVLGAYPMIAGVVVTAPVAAT